MTRLQLSLFGLVLFCAGAAMAQAGGGEASPRPVRVTTFLLRHPGLDEATLNSLMRDLGEGLRRNPRLEMKELDTRLAEFAQEIPQAEIDKAHEQLAAGQAALRSLELDAAVRQLAAAVDGLSRVLPYIKKQELADAMALLAVAQLEQGNGRVGHATLVRLLTWRPDFRYDVNRYPPDLVGSFEEARREVERNRRGSIEIRSEPPSAQAYVDGKYVGATPTFAEGLSVGEHWVTLKREGFRKAVTAATVSAKRQETVAIALERSKKYLLVEQSLEAIEKKLGRPQLEASADDLKEILFIDQGVFVRAQPGAAATVVDLYLYDLRTRLLLAHEQRTVAKGGDEGKLGAVAVALYQHVNYDGELEAPREAPPPKPVERRKFYKTWWFWTATGALVVAVTLAAVLAPRPKDCGSGNYCPGFSF